MAMLETPVAPVDTVNMHEMTDLLTEQQDLISVLAAYRDAEQADAKEPPRAAAAPGAPVEADVSEAENEHNSEPRWIPRLRDLPGIAAEQLAPLHGQLIAHGLLRFNLLGRKDGVGYRVTPEGRQALTAVQ